MTNPAKKKNPERERDWLRVKFTTEDPLRVHVITLSDRAAAGVYPDKSGDLLESRVQTFFDEGGIPLTVSRTLLPDNPPELREAILEACDTGAHIVFTTGGTGVGPRDNTPEVVLELAEKVIPGIMELIRMKYGADKPCALLSRTVAATRGQTLLYALPGSSKGVDEYMTEIVKTVEHLLCVLHELEVHG